ncbi:hypothetical protein Ciccas_007895 [Cichlidogyrus casuarinus]|uniref:Uncharacterized protein n=1 Tax=Cichlidogyrus casuarinus TaxID=1844966 RepID=A0ABD2Q1H9_9PLAT
MGQVQLYTKEIKASSGQFFADEPCETLLAEPLAETLQMSLGRQHALGQMKLDQLTEAAGAMAFFQVAGASNPSMQLGISESQVLPCADASKMEAMRDVGQAATRPVSYDNPDFHLSSVPQSAHPPPLFDPFTDQMLLNQDNSPKTISDWPQDCIGRIDRRAYRIDEPELNKCTQSNKTQHVRKPDYWNTVWHPYTNPQNWAAGIQLSKFNMARFAVNNCTNKFCIFDISFVKLDNILHNSIGSSKKLELRMSYVSSLKILQTS